MRMEQGPAHREELPDDRRTPSALAIRFSFIWLVKQLFQMLEAGHTHAHLGFGGPQRNMKRGPGPWDNGFQTRGSGRIDVSLRRESLAWLTDKAIHCPFLGF